jgi:hypothetical protein
VPRDMKEYMKPENKQHVSYVRLALSRANVAFGWQRWHSLAPLARPRRCHEHRMDSARLFQFLS